MINENLIKFDNVSEHIELVHFAGKRLCRRLIGKGEIMLAQTLGYRIFKHDCSKFMGIEFDNLNGLAKNPQSLSEAIEKHRRTNPHHPEYHGPNGIHIMSDDLLCEFICDTWARCAVSGQNFETWIKEEATKRYGFTLEDKVYSKLMRFAAILLDRPMPRIS